MIQRNHYSWALHMHMHAPLYQQYQLKVSQSHYFCFLINVIHTWHDAQGKVTRY